MCLMYVGGYLVIGFEDGNVGIFEDGIEKLTVCCHLESGI